MNILSINLNQRLGSPAVRHRFEGWLKATSTQILLAQEPFKISAEQRPAIGSFRLAGTTPYISSWFDKEVSCQSVDRHHERWLELQFKGFFLHNVYLSPNSSRERALLMREIAKRLEKLGDLAHIVVGDFNLAPRPEDGLFGLEHSTFTKRAEREAFAELINKGDLFDATCPMTGFEPEFTIERMLNQRASRFRCDLALISNKLQSAVTVRYDHSVRIGKDAFTDHSAVIINVDNSRRSGGRVRA